MMLARIEPSPAGSDMRTFECPKCNHVHKTLVDPMKLVSGWQNSGLNAPK
jgi:transcription elongation factor Elf1